MPESPLCTNPLLLHSALLLSSTKTESHSWIKIRFNSQWGERSLRACAVRGKSCCPEAILLELSSSWAFPLLPNLPTVSLFPSWPRCGSTSGASQLRPPPDMHWGCPHWPSAPTVLVQEVAPAAGSKADTACTSPISTPAGLWWRKKGTCVCQNPATLARSNHASPGTAVAEWVAGW